ncbi:MAG: Gldg family protein [Planctomycetota bacterium]|jgi:ABC-type uncharacterized transport system involved in gliding motility auxiliary subunit
MTRTIRAILGVVFILIIAFSAIHIGQHIGKGLKKDITEQKLYTLSDGTKAILAKLNQPIKMKLYYAQTAALKGPDQIRYFNNYYQFVKSILEEYTDVAKGMIDLEIIDPRPYSEDELQAMRYGLKKFPITEEENFFFGLVVQTQFGVEKVVPFFSPDRQNFVEYDISYLIDTAITRQKTKLGIMSSLPVMGQDVSGYMARMMMMQGQKPKPPWTIVEQLRNEYEVTTVAVDVNEINDVDILLVIHPKELSEKTLFAIDQFILKGGRTIVCVDPHCFADRPQQNRGMMMTGQSQSSNMEKLLRTWGLEMPEKVFAGDRSLAVMAAVNPNQRPQKLIGYLGLTSPKCFDSESVITGNLNEVKVLFAGVLRQITEPNSQSAPNIEKTPLIMTTNRGNSWSVSDSFELMMIDPPTLMKRFSDGTEPVTLGYLLNGKFKSSFPDGIDIEVEAEEDDSAEKPEDKDEKEKKKIKKHIEGLTEAEEDCIVVVISDVDFISDMLAYQKSFFGKMVVGDNSALLMNAIDDLSGSSDLISVRSRGSFKRPFHRIDEIEAKAEAETAEEEAKIGAEITGFQNELNSLQASSQEENKNEVIGGTIVQKVRDIELKIHEAKKRQIEVKRKKRESIERTFSFLKNLNMMVMPIIILIIAVILGVRRTIRKRHYISHASDA